MSVLVDDLDNLWGVELLNHHHHLDGREGAGTKHELDALVISSVPGHKYRCMTESGTAANRFAIESATGNAIDRCLVGMGSYVGGDGNAMEELSSSGFSPSKSLSFPKKPSDCTAAAQRQTVALPHHTKMMEESDDLIELENECLVAVEKKLMLNQHSGHTFRALLMEYILGGNGGELSSRFLEKLANVLVRYEITVIADEILTGGRVGPGMTMTTSIAKPFRKLVRFITMGKIYGCGIVLERSQTKPTVCTLSGRGLSTTLPPGKACHRWKYCCDKIWDGTVEKRRKEIVKKFQLNPEQNWGRGCLIFGSFHREHTVYSFGCRYLPKLENVKVRKGNGYLSEFNRTSVTGMLADKAKTWMQLTNTLELCRQPILNELVLHVSREMNQGSAADKVRLSPQELMTMIGETKTQELANCQREIEARKNFKRRSCKKAKALFEEIFRSAAQSAPAIVHQVRCAKRRRLTCEFTMSN